MPKLFFKMSNTSIAVLKVLSVGSG